MPPSFISADEFARLPNLDTASVIDVRTGAEFKQAHLTVSRHIPLDKIEVGSLKELPAGQPVYLICQQGGRAAKAAEKLTRSGHQLIVVSGGLEALKHQPVTLNECRSSQHISLERQVRIAAGSLVLAGVLSGTLINPAFYGISAFVGAGLVFAGITNWCGMALLLAKMPWNR